MWLRFNGSGIFPSIWFASGLCCARWPATQLHFSRTPNAAPRDGWPPGMARGSTAPRPQATMPEPTGWRGRGREAEALGAAKARDGQVVLISGEPGIGKSRITAALEERLHAEPHLRLRYFCSPHHQDSALFPFIDQLDRASNFARDDPPAAKLKKLETSLARAMSLDEDVAFLADLLSLPPSERHPLPNLSPQRKKERTLG